MTRRRAALPRREPNGRHDRALDRLVDARSPTEVRRLRDAALSGLRAPEWGSELGRLLLHGKLTTAQFEAGKRFAILSHEYHTTLGAPNFTTTSLVRNGPSGHTEGPTDAERYRQVIQAWDQATAVLAPLERGSLVVLRLACERDTSVSTTDALRKLRTGLDTLATHWGIPA